MTRFVILSLLVHHINTTNAQSWFDKNFELDAIELKFGQSGISKITWNDGMYGASALKHLNDGYDNGGLKQNRLATTRPFDVEYSYNYCTSSAKVELLGSKAKREFMLI